MFHYHIITPPLFDFKNEIIDEIFSTISQEIPDHQNGIVNIVFVPESEIQELNKTYREKDSVTDVLSFHYYDSFENTNSNEIAGEIILCESKIFSQWIEYWLWTEKEFYKLLIHSTLHLLWYDHEEDEEYEIMQNLENLIWEKIFEKNK